MESGLRKLITTLALILIIAVIRVHLHFIRLLLLAAFGLLGLYLLHRLAQDWNRLTASSNKPSMAGGSGNRPVLSSLFGMASGIFRLSKRSVSNTDFHLASNNVVPNTPVTRRDELLLSHVSKYDQLGCVRKFICYLATKNTNKYTASEYNTIRLLQSAKNEKDRDSSSLEAAMELGRNHRNETICNETFKSCRFTNNQLHIFYSGL